MIGRNEWTWDREQRKVALSGTRCANNSEKNISSRNTLVSDGRKLLSPARPKRSVSPFLTSPFLTHSTLYIYIAAFLCFLYISTISTISQSLHDAPASANLISNFFSPLRTRQLSSEVYHVSDVSRYTAAHLTLLLLLYLLPHVLEFQAVLPFRIRENFQVKISYHCKNVWTDSNIFCYILIILLGNIATL